MQLIRFTTGVPPMVKTVLITRDNDGRVHRVYEPKRTGQHVDITDTIGPLSIEAIQAKVDSDALRMEDIRFKQREAIEAAASARRNDYDEVLTSDGRRMTIHNGD